MEETCKENDELEEGECSDQDDDGMLTPEQMKQPDPQAKAVPTSTSVYRQACIPQIVINSDQSDSDTSEDDDDDDDDNDFYHSRGKKTCKFPNPVDEPYGSSGNAFVNPLRSPGMAQTVAEGASRKRRNNVWGAVMTEQILSQDIKQFGVNAPISGGYSRDVESYDFTIAKEDDRPTIDVNEEEPVEKEDIFGGVVDLEKEVKKQQRRKRKRNIKERLGPKSDHPGKNKLGPLNVTENDEAGKVIEAIILGLEEQNKTLFTRIVETIGKEKAIQVYNKTVDVESVGGMMTNNGFRRRTPGGVYIQLMKNEPSIPEDVQSAIFEQENQKWAERRKELRKIKTAARKKWKRKEKRLNYMDYDRTETPTPTKELEELENGNENENEVEADVDVGDLPDRPDTPEPKDSSDNVSEGEECDDDEDEEDIAVVIAKAKAAILKKQKEMSTSKTEQSSQNSKIDEDENVGAAMADENVEMS